MICKYIHTGRSRGDCRATDIPRQPGDVRSRGAKQTPRCKVATSVFDPEGDVDHPAASRGRRLFPVSSGETRTSRSCSPWPRALEQDDGLHMVVARATVVTVVILACSIWMLVEIGFLRG